MKEIIKRIKESIKSFAEHSKELIKAFTEPAKEEQSLNELAVAAGIGDNELNILKQSMGGVNWKFADESEEPKKGRKSKITPTETRVQPVQKIKTTERESGIGRD